MKTTEAVTSGVSSSRLTGWRPAWEGWSAAAGFAAAGTTAAMVPGWWGAGLASVLALMGVVRTAEALRTASRRIPLAGFAPAFIHAGDLIRILREKGMDEKKADDPVRKTARERLVARYEAGRIALLDSMRFIAGREGRLVKNLWIGRGFEWTPAHAQALYELAATPVKPVIVPQRIRKALSLPDPLGAGDIGRGRHCASSLESRRRHAHRRHDSGREGRDAHEPRNPVDPPGRARHRHRPQEQQASSQRRLEGGRDRGSSRSSRIPSRLSRNGRQT